jgi:hypothetical protein
VFNVFDMVRCASTLLSETQGNCFAEAVEVRGITQDVVRKNRNSQNVWRAQCVADYNEGKNAIKKKGGDDGRVSIGHAVVEYEEKPTNTNLIRPREPRVCHA